MIWRNTKLERAVYFRHSCRASPYGSSRLPRTQSGRHIEAQVNVFPPPTHIHTAMSLLRTFSPAVRPQSLPWTVTRCLAQQQQSTSFSTTANLQKRAKGGPRKDPRISTFHLPPPPIHTDKLASTNSLPSPTRLDSPSAPLLPQSRSPPLDHPPRLAALHGRPTPNKRERTRATIQRYGSSL